MKKVKYVTYQECEKIARQAVKDGLMIPTEKGYKIFVKANPHLNLPLSPDKVY